MKETVKACPICGRLVRVHCYHDGSVNSVDLPWAVAEKLILSSIEDAEEELENWRDSLQMVREKNVWEPPTRPATPRT